MHRRLVYLAVIAVIALLLGACADEDDTGPPPTPTLVPDHYATPRREIERARASLETAVMGMQQSDRIPPSCSRSAYDGIQAQHYPRKSSIRLQVVISVDDSGSAAALVDSTVKASRTLLPLLRGGDKFIAFLMNDQSSLVSERPPVPNYHRLSDQVGWPDPELSLPPGLIGDGKTLIERADELLKTDLASLWNSASDNPGRATLGEGGSRRAEEDLADRSRADRLLGEWEEASLTLIEDNEGWNTRFADWRDAEDAWIRDRDYAESLCRDQRSYEKSIEDWRTRVGTSLYRAKKVSDADKISPIPTVANRARLALGIDNLPSRADGALNVFILSGDAERFDAAAERTIQDYDLNRALLGIHVIVGPYRPSIYVRQDYNLDILRKSLGTGCPLSLQVVSTDDEGALHDAVTALLDAASTSSITANRCPSNGASG